MKSGLKARIAPRSTEHPLGALEKAQLAELMSGVSIRNGVGYCLMNKNRRYAERRRIIKMTPARPDSIQSAALEGSGTGLVL